MVAVAVAVGVVFRFVTRTSLWLDEALSVNIASLPLGDIATALRHDGHPPLYYWLLHVWIAVFGGGDQAVRALSGVLSLACVPVVALVARRMAGRRTAVVAAVLMATSPFAIRYGTEARMYALVMLLVATGWYCILRLLEPGASWRWTAGVSICVGALLLTHYWAIYLLGAVALVLLAAALRSPRQSPLREGVVRVALAGFVGALAFVPWIPAFLDQLRHTGTPWATRARPGAVLADTIDNLGGFVKDGEILGIVLVMLMVVAVFADRAETGTDQVSDGVRGSDRGAGAVRIAAWIVVATLAIACAAIAASNGAYATRYASVIVPLVVVLAAIGVERLRAAAGRSAVLAMCVVLAVPGIVFNVRNDRTQGGEMVEVINANAVANDLVVYCPDQLGPAGSRHLRGDLRASTIPDLTSPSLVDWRDYADRNARTDPEALAQTLDVAAAGSSIWMVWNGGYRTYSDQCERIVQALSSVRSAETLVNARTGVFEPMNLVRLAP
ncbi:MAG: glycosyltransferase family 39 protein [Acidimicrobiia bacterium]